MVTANSMTVLVSLFLLHNLAAQEQPTAPTERPGIATRQIVPGVYGLSTPTPDGLVSAQLVNLPAPQPPQAAATGNIRDGNWWLQCDTEEKLYYTIGTMDGFWLSGIMTVWAPADRGSEGAAPSGSPTWKAMLSMHNKYFGTVTNNQLVNGIDEFYSDFKNRRIDTPNAIWVVLNQIAGTTPAALQAMVETLRRNASGVAP
jgi:hypothetical protein